MILEYLSSTFPLIANAGKSLNDPSGSPTERSHLLVAKMSRIMQGVPRHCAEGSAINDRVRTSRPRRRHRNTSLLKVLLWLA